MKFNTDSSPSNRIFGFLFCGIFFGISAYAAFHNASAFKIYGWLAAGAAVGLASVVAPNLLTPFNRVWMKFGELMGKVVSPLVLGIIFFVLITPVALISRLFCRDELRLKKANTNSYWNDRVPPGPASESFKNQF